MHQATERQVEPNWYKCPTSQMWKLRPGQGCDLPRVTASQQDPQARSPATPPALPNSAAVTQVHLRVPCTSQAASGAPVLPKVGRRCRSRGWAPPLCQLSVWEERDLISPPWSPGRAAPTARFPHSGFCATCAAHRLPLPAGRLRKGQGGGGRKGGLRGPGAPPRSLWLP